MGSDGLIITVLVGIEWLEVGLNTLSKAAMSRGMSNFVFLVYSNSLALILLLPLTFFFHRFFRPAPPISSSIIFRIFLLALTSCCVQTFMYIGIRLSSATLSSAMTDLTPAFTFILALITRMERIQMREDSSKAKTIGTIVCITGALFITFYKGPCIFPFSHFATLHLPFSLFQPNWIFGGLLLALAAFSLALVHIVQTWIIKEYPAELMVTVICCFFTTVQLVVIALIVEGFDPDVWKIQLDMEFVTICYSAIGLGLVRNIVHIWALKKKGPVFVVMFKPLGIVIAVIMGVFFLGDVLYIGSVIGGIFVAVGFYALLWGKSKEQKAVHGENGSISSSSSKLPLLSNRT